ncbi:hypothetical protein ACVBEQ_09865 [Nakamurella sp. GG22]
MIVVRRFFFAMSLCCGLLLGAALPVGAVGPFGSDQIIVNCIPGPMAASIASDGTTSGFSPCTGGIGDGPLIYFSQKPPGGIVREGSPYTGKVLATAWDGVDALYVVFSQGNDLKIAKRVQSTGAYSATTLLATDSGAVPFTADVVASAGKWWAVWSRQVGPGGEFAQTELFQRHTLLGTEAATRITNTSASVDDSEPTLGFSGGRLTMIWTRTTTPALPGQSDLRIARNTGSGWASSTLASIGYTNDRPDSMTIGATTFVTWQRDGKIVQADNSTGSFVSKTFATPGSGPKIGASFGKVFVGWNTTTDTFFFAERSGGAWTGTTLGAFPGGAVAVLGQGGKARAIYTEDERHHLRVQL